VCFKNKTYNANSHIGAKAFIWQTKWWRLPAINWGQRASRMANTASMRKQFRIIARLLCGYFFTLAEFWHCKSSASKKKATTHFYWGIANKTCKFLAPQICKHLPSRLNAQPHPLLLCYVLSV